MNEVQVIEVGQQALYVTLKISAPIMILGLASGLIIALFQALTTIQEMTLTFVPKIVVIFFATVIFLPFMITTLLDFSRELFERMTVLG